MKSVKQRAMNLGIGMKLMLYFLALSLVPLLIGGTIRRVLDRAGEK